MSRFITVGLISLQAMRFISSLHALKSIALRGKSMGGFGVSWRRFSSEWDDLGGPPPLSRPSPKQPSASSVKPKVSSWREREGERGSKVFSRERDGGSGRGGSGVWGEGSEQEGRGGSSGRNPSRPSFDRFRGEGRGDRGSSRPSFASEGGIKRDTSRPPYSSSRTAPPSSSSFQRRDSEDGFSRGGIPSSRGKYEFEDRDLNREPAYGNYDGDHLYGVSPVRLALGSMRRNISELLVQSGMDLSNKKDEKLVSEILSIAKEKNITVTELSKHDLNMLTDNRPHQGFVLRATPLEFTKMVELAPSEDFKCVLALDEVWDPQVCFPPRLNLTLKANIVITLKWSFCFRTLVLFSARPIFLLAIKLLFAQRTQLHCPLQ